MMKVNPPMARDATPRATRKLATLALAAAASLLAACPPAEEMTDGGSDGPVGVQPTFTSLYGDYFGNCKQCHAPGAPGRTGDIEQTLDFTSKTTAYMTIKNGMATGLTGNHVGCNGVRFLGTTAATSLILAVLDQPTRQTIDITGSPNCDVDSITDATVKSGKQPSSEFVSALKSWINAGAPNN